MFCSASVFAISTIFPASRVIVPQVDRALGGRTRGTMPAETSSATYLVEPPMGHGGLIPEKKP